MKPEEIIKRLNEDGAVGEWAHTEDAGVHWFTYTLAFYGVGKRKFKHAIDAITMSTHGVMNVLRKAIGEQLSHFVFEGLYHDAD